MGNLSDDLRRNRQQKNDAEVQAEIERQRQQSGKIDGTAKVRGYNPKLGGWDVETSTGGTVKGAAPHTTRGLGKGDSVDIYRRGNSAAIDAKPLTGAAANTSGDGGKSGADGQPSGPRLIRVPGGRSGTEPRFQQDDGSSSGNGCTCKEVFTTSNTGAEGQSIFNSVEECLEDCAKKTGDEGGGPWACFEDSSTGEASIQYVGEGGDFASKEAGETAIQPKFKGGQCSILYTVTARTTGLIANAGAVSQAEVRRLCRIGRTERELINGVPQAETVIKIDQVATHVIRGPIKGARTRSFLETGGSNQVTEVIGTTADGQENPVLFGFANTACDRLSIAITSIRPFDPTQADNCGDPPKRCPSPGLDEPGNIIDLGD
jgi:hypothetical protein